MSSVKIHRTLRDVFHADVARLKLSKKQFDVRLTRNSDGTLQADSKALEENFDLLQDLCSVTEFRVPTTVAICRALAQVDRELEMAVSGCGSRRAHLCWVQDEAEKIHHLLSHLNRRCQRSRTSKFHRVNLLKKMYWSQRGKQPLFADTSRFQQHLDDLVSGAPADDVLVLGHFDSPAAGNIPVLALADAGVRDPPPRSDPPHSSPSSADLPAVVDLVSEDDWDNRAPSYAGDSSSDEGVAIPTEKQCASAAPLPAPPHNMQVATATAENEPIEVPAPNRRPKATTKGEKAKRKGNGKKGKGKKAAPEKAKTGGRKLLKAHKLKRRKRRRKLITGNEEEAQPKKKKRGEDAKDAPEEAPEGKIYIRKMQDGRYVLLQPDGQNGRKNKQLCNLQVKRFGEQTQFFAETFKSLFLLGCTKANIEEVKAKLIKGETVNVHGKTLKL